MASPELIFFQSVYIDHKLNRLTPHTLCQTLFIPSGNVRGPERRSGIGSRITGK